jgi:hypothetical protein
MKRKFQNDDYFGIEDRVGVILGMAVRGGFLYWILN